MMEREEQFVTLQAGHYWQAKVAIKKEEILKGDVLLVVSVRDVDKQAHTIILRPHPRWYAANPRCEREHRFLVDEFLEKFEPCPDWKRIRQAELDKVQGKVTQLQHELAEASTNPDAMKSHVDTGLRKWEKTKKLLPGSSGDLPPVTAETTLDASLTTEKVETMKLSMAKVQEVASLQAAYIKEKVELIGETVQAMTPFYQEQAAAALATTDDIQTHVAKLLTGVRSLDLYVGTDVHVKQLKKGANAPDVGDEPQRLAIMQRKLYMDEELSAWVDVDKKFDFNSDVKFFEALAAEPSLVKQIFATERCIVCMATTRRQVEYGNAWEDAQKNEINKQVFLLVRNGENLYVVYSPVESHMRSPRLFPSKKEVDEIFRERAWFGEKEGKLVTFKDVKYTDKLSEHEALAVHYKRFLIMLAGLDHRENLFGPFYDGPKNMKFISMEFQKQHLNFIYDDEGSGNLLPEEDRPGFKNWVKAKNAYMQSGSRVICMWHDIMNHHTAPGVVKYNWRSTANNKEYWNGETTETYGVKIAYREGKHIFVKCPIKHDVYGRYVENHTRLFNASVNLSKYEHWDIGYICLDAVKADELEWYVYDRTNRSNFLSYIRLFKFAVKYLRNEEKQEAATRAKLAKALADGGVAAGKEADKAIDLAVIAWRAAHRGEPLTSADDKEEFPKLLNQIWTISRNILPDAKSDWKQAEKWANAQGLKPLRLVQSGKAQTLALYCAPKPEEEDNRLWPMAWVHRIALLRDGDDFKEQTRSWKVLLGANARETTLHEWEGAAKWADLPTPVEKFSEKQAAFDKVIAYVDKRAILQPMKAGAWDMAYNTWLRLRTDLSSKGRGYVQNPTCAIPVGLMLRRNKLYFLAVGTYDAAVLLYKHAPDAARKEKLAREYSSVYRLSENAYKRITGKEKESGDMRMNINILYFQVHEELREFGICKISSHNLESDVRLDKLDAAIKKVIKAKDEPGEPKFWLPESEKGATA